MPTTPTQSRTHGRAHTLTNALERARTSPAPTIATGLSLSHVRSTCPHLPQVSFVERFQLKHGLTWVKARCVARARARALARVGWYLFPPVVRCHVALRGDQSMRIGPTSCTKYRTIINNDTPHDLCLLVSLAGVSFCDWFILYVHRAHLRSTAQGYLVWLRSRDEWDPCRVLSVASAHELPFASLTCRDSFPCTIRCLLQANHLIGIHGYEMRYVYAAPSLENSYPAIDSSSTYPTYKPRIV